MTSTAIDSALIKPLNFPNPINSEFGNLKYKVKVQFQNGELVLADPRSTRALIALMDMQAVIGGAASHFGGPAAFAELLSALFGLVLKNSDESKTPWPELFHFVNDAGHCENGIYALKANLGMQGLKIEDLRGFRSINSKLTGHGEAHLFPDGILLSNGPLGSAFPQSMGLALADHLQGKKRITVTAISDGAMMEGEAREACASIPGFAKRGLLAPYILIISDNNTKLTGRIDKESFSMAPTFNTLSNLGWKVLQIDDGHDIQKCLNVIANAFEAVKNDPTQPVAIHAMTIKGFGNKKCAESASGGHGFPLKSATELTAFLQEIYEGDLVPAEFVQWVDDLVLLEANQKKSQGTNSNTGEKIQVGISSAMIEAAQKGLPVISISADLPGSTGVAGFRKQFPQNSFDVGVAESNMVSMAAGLSRGGYIPVVDTFAQFGVTKGALPLIMANLSGAPIIAVYSHTGFQDAADGASHQALTYLSMSMSIPHTNVFSLSCKNEAHFVLSQVIQKFSEDRQAGRTPNSSILFLGRENFPSEYLPNTQFNLKIPTTVYTSKNQNKVLIISSGSMVPECIAATQVTETQGIGATIIHPTELTNPDWDFIKDQIKICENRVIIVEDHQMPLGMGAHFYHQLSLQGVNFKSQHLAVKSDFGRSAYTAAELYAHHNLGKDAVITALRALVK